MRKRGYSIAVIGLLALACISGDRAAENEKKFLEGSWETIAVELNGRKTAGEALDEEDRIALVFSDRELRSSRKIRRIENGKTTWKEKHETASYTLYPQRNPKAIDLTYSRKGKNETVKAIYSLEGGVLKMCFPPDTGMDRPARIEGKLGRDEVVFTLRRKKP